MNAAEILSAAALCIIAISSALIAGAVMARRG